MIYFPRFPRAERIVIEAYDLDAFRDPGVHWLYLQGAIEPNPFAAELVVEGAAQFGVLALRVAGRVAKEKDSPRLELAHLEDALRRIQGWIDRHAKRFRRRRAPRPLHRLLRGLFAGRAALALAAQRERASGQALPQPRQDALRRRDEGERHREPTRASGSGITG